MLDHMADSRGRAGSMQRGDPKARQLLREGHKIAGLAAEAFEAFRRKARLQGDGLFEGFHSGKIFHVREERAEILFPKLQRLLRKRRGVDEKGRRHAKGFLRFRRGGRSDWVERDRQNDGSWSKGRNSRLLWS